MTGHNVPYQLRTNKYVERQLFLDIIDFVRVWNGPSQYLYSAMGGRFLEDFRLVNSRFAIEHMISIELDHNTWMRQEFNRLGFIDCRHQSSGDFVDSFDRLVQDNPGKRFITWLDYAAPNARGEQLGEYRRLLSKMASGDVAKLTLNANSNSYRRRSGPLTKKDFDAYLKNTESATHKDFETYLNSLIARGGDDDSADVDRTFTLSDTEYETICIKNLKNQLDEYLPRNELVADDLKSDAFARLLAESVQVAALRAVEGSQLQMIPLAAFRYRDGEHQMLTVTAILADGALATRIADDQVFSNWPLRANGWSQVHEVDVPDISAKERHFIDGFITQHHEPAQIQAEIPFWLGESEQLSISLLTAYLQHYRRYPTFGRIH